jgi:EmrB/QacA subfamily drug resistance transporter
MLGVGLGVLMSTLDSSIVNISLPTLVQELDTTFATIQWVVLSYLLVITSLMLSVARLGDMYGKKKLYNIGLVLFTLGSLLCGLSPSVGWLIGFRALQGTGAVTMTALGSAIITEVFPSSERGRALGIIGSIVSIGIALGPSLGGVLIGTVGWRAVFLVNVPLGLLAAVIVFKVVPPLAPGERGQRFDVAGAAILFLMLGGYALGMTLGQDMGFDSRPVLALLAVAGVGLVAFLSVQTRSSHPMIDLSLFRNILFGVNLLMATLVFIVVAGQFLFPFFLQLVQGYSVQQAGLLIGVFPLMMGIVAPISGALSDRFGSRVISLIGLISIATACVLVSTLHEGVGLAGFALRLVPLGIGVGMFNSPNNSAVMGAAPRNRLGIASGLLALSRTLGQTTGIPLMGAIFSSLVLARAGLPAGADVTAAPAAALVAGLAGTYRIAAGFILASTILAVFALWFDRRSAIRPDAAPQTAAAPPLPAGEAPAAPPVLLRDPDR